MGDYRVGPSGRPVWQPDYPGDRPMSGWTALVLLAVVCVGLALIRVLLGF